MSICTMYWKKGTYSENVPYLLGSFFCFINLFCLVKFLLPNDETCVLICAKSFVPQC